MNWHLGTVGFGYKQWRGVFYPAGMQPRSYLNYYASSFNSVEIDSTFYGTPSVDKVVGWRNRTPDNFTLCPKTPQQITHDMRLHDAADAMRVFVKNMQTLGPKLGPILIQLPPDFTPADQPTLLKFCDQLMVADGVRYAIEFRNRAWERPQTAAILRQFNICWVAADYVIMPRKIHPTTDFLYMRFLGKHGRYATKDRELRDPTADLQRWYTALEPHLAKFQNIYGYFNNDYAGYSPESCNKLKRIIGLDTTPSKAPQQASLF